MLLHLALMSKFNEFSERMVKIISESVKNWLDVTLDLVKITLHI